MLYPLPVGSTRGWVKLCTCNMLQGFFGNTAIIICQATWDVSCLYVSYGINVLKVHNLKSSWVLRILSDPKGVMLLAALKPRHAKLSASVEFNSLMSIILWWIMCIYIHTYSIASNHVVHFESNHAYPAGAPGLSIVCIALCFNVQI